MVLSTQKASSPWCKYQKTNKGLGEAFHQMEFAANIFLPSPPPQKSQTTTPSSAYVHLETSKKGNPVDQLLFSFFSFLYVRYSLLQRTEYEYIQLSVNSFFSSYLMVSHVKSNANNTSFVLENKDSHFASSISKRLLPSLRRLFKEGKKKRQYQRRSLTRSDVKFEMICKENGCALP